MDPARPSNPSNYLTLKEAAESLAVSVDVLLSWNDNNILKPTITPTGEVGYTKQQVEQFMAIRSNSQLMLREKSLQNNSNFSQNTNSPIENVVLGNAPNVNNQPTNNFSQINNYNFYNTPSDPPQKNKSIFSILGVAASFSVILIGIFVILFSQEDKLNSLMSQNKDYSNGSNILAAGSNESNLNSLEEKKNKFSNNLSNEGASFSQNKITVLDKAFDDKKGSVSASTSKTNKNHLALVGVAAASNEEVITGPNIDSGVSSTYNQKANYNESSDCTDCNENPDTENVVFDTEGNIKVSKNESDENRLIATRLAMGGINQNQQQIKQNTNSVTLVSFLILGSFAFYVIYSRKRQLFPSLDHSENLDIQPQNLISPMEKIKILEVFQKTDGTVVLMFQGKEYKISKPELDSESDKFIDRLFHLVGPSIKEVEYDALQDDELMISTPLSKLVTRLGFVGIKRDLFFPRTSKSRVHFRKYLTAEDLISMNLTAEDISTGFTASN